MDRRLFIKIWHCITYAQLFLGVFSLGIGLAIGPTMLWAAVTTHNPEHWEVTLLFGGAGLLLTANLAYIIIGEFNDLRRG